MADFNYEEYQATAEYNSKQAGSAIEIQIINEADFADIVIGAASGLNSSENMEALTVEEAGEDGANEIVQGRHDGSLSVTAFWTPRWNDSAPTRQTFIGRTFTIMERVGAKRVGEGAILNVYTGCTIRSVGHAVGARGLTTFDFSFVFKTRYNGKEWAAR